MAQRGMFDVGNAQQFGQVVDTIQSKLSKVLATVAAINAAIASSGIPSQASVGTNNPLIASANTAQPNTASANPANGFNGLPTGSGLNPSLQAAMLQSSQAGMNIGGQNTNGGIFCYILIIPIFERKITFNQRFFRSTNV